MIIHIRKVANGYVITKEPDAALISPQPPTFVAEYETDAHRIVGELLGVTEALDQPQEASNAFATIDTTDFDMDQARIFMDDAKPQDARAGALMDAFDWQYSPQGYDFWYTVCKNMRLDTNDANTIKGLYIVARSIEKYERDNS